MEGRGSITVAGDRTCPLLGQSPPRFPVVELFVLGSTAVVVVVAAGLQSQLVVALAVEALLHTQTVAEVVQVLAHTRPVAVKELAVEVLQTVLCVPHQLEPNNCLRNVPLADNVDK